MGKLEFVNSKTIEIHQNHWVFVESQAIFQAINLKMRDNGIEYWVERNLLKVDGPQRSMIELLMDHQLDYELLDGVWQTWLRFTSSEFSALCL